MTKDQYKCEECGATFNTQAELDAHIRSMHSQHKCEVCGQSFSSKDELEEHNRTMHPEAQRTPR